MAFDRVYDTDAADLWETLTDPERLARWFARVDGDLREGGRFTIHFDDDDVPDCRVTSCDAPRGYTLGVVARHAYLAGHRRRRTAGEGARLRLTHTRLSSSSAAGYAAGWDVYLRRLDELVAGREVRDTWSEDWSGAHEGYAAQLG